LQLYYVNLPNVHVVFL